MKYILHIKVPIHYSDEEFVKIVEQSRKQQVALGDDYHVIVTKGLGLIVYPNLVYSIAFTLKQIRNWDWSRLYKWALIN